MDPLLLWPHIHHCVCGSPPQPGKFWTVGDIPCDFLGLLQLFLPAKQKQKIEKQKQKVFFIFIFFGIANEENVTTLYTLQD